MYASQAAQATFAAQPPGAAFSRQPSSFADGLWWSLLLLQLLGGDALDWRFSPAVQKDLPEQSGLL